MLYTDQLPLHSNQHVQEGHLRYVPYAALLLPPHAHDKRLTGTMLAFAIVDKATWWGCGNHVPTIMDSVPEEDRCACEPQVEREGKMYPPMAKQPA